MDTVVLFDEITTASGHRLGVATLNAEKSLNALNADMIRLLDARLSIWARDSGIAAVLLRGAGDKAFCAGGDVRALRESLLADRTQHWPNADACAFFSSEYQLDYRIHTYAKPLLVWGSGIVMGGGLGLMAGASHRIATASTRIAMPEISIGLYPDVAASWFLQRMPGKSGLFLGLTGAPLNARDAVACNLADYILPQQGWHALCAALTQQQWHDDAAANHAALGQLLSAQAAANLDAVADSRLLPLLPQVQQLMSLGSLHEVDRVLRRQAFDHDWLNAAAASYLAGNPGSAAVTWEIFHRARHLSLAQALRMELVLSLNFCAGPDLREGVRALLVDKDRQPRWSRPTLDSVDRDWIEQHFRSPWRDADHPLAALA